MGRTEMVHVQYTYGIRSISELHIPSHDSVERKLDVILNTVCGDVLCRYVPRCDAAGNRDDVTGGGGGPLIGNDEGGDEWP